MVSVVIPTLEEERGILGALRSLEGEPHPHEVIVVDGGSRDRTRQLASGAGARVMLSPRGRGVQMNAGARQARGEVLLFLHADTRLPPGALAELARAAARPGVVGGGFLKRYDGAGPLLKVSAMLLNLVWTRLLGRLVGTQAVFVRRETFARLGGYHDWALLEDVNLVDRMRREGRLVMLRGPVTVSARRYRERGTLRQLLVNAVVILGYWSGRSPSRLRRLYDGMR